MPPEATGGEELHLVLVDSAKLGSALGTPHQQLEADGYAVVQNAVSERVLENIKAKLDARRAGRRNLLSVPVIRELASSQRIRGLIEPILPNAFAVRGILFNKLPGANWKVAWHQDCVIAVQEQKSIIGWGPWSVKAGVHHVRPPAGLLARMLAVRIHLDDCGEHDGPLRVLPGSHQSKFLSDEQILGWRKENAVTCVVGRGDAILMRPLLLHASSAATVPRSRRVIHIEFAAEELPNGMKWHERI